MYGPLVFGTGHGRNKGGGGLLEHAVTAVPLYGRGWNALCHAGHQVSLPREVVVRQVFNLRGNYTQRGEQHL